MTSSQYESVDNPVQVVSVDVECNVSNNFDRITAIEEKSTVKIDSERAERLLGNSHQQSNTTVVAGQHLSL